MTVFLSSLRDDELDLLRETEPERMAELDEDELLQLHTRVRRARTTYVRVYRRQASTRVEDLGGRGFAPAAAGCGIRWVVAGAERVSCVVTSYSSES